MSLKQMLCVTAATRETLDKWLNPNLANIVSLFASLPDMYRNDMLALLGLRAAKATSTSWIKVVPLPNLSDFTENESYQATMETYMKGVRMMAQRMNRATELSRSTEAHQFLLTVLAV